MTAVSSRARLVVRFDAIAAALALGMTTEQVCTSLGVTSSRVSRAKHHYNLAHGRRGFKAAMVEAVRVEGLRPVEALAPFDADPVVSAAIATFTDAVALLTDSPLGIAERKAIGSIGAPVPLDIKLEAVSGLIELS